MHQSTLFFQIINNFFLNHAKNQTHLAHYFSEFDFFDKNYQKTLAKIVKTIYF